MGRTLQYHQALALAGVFQAADLAHHIASRGKINQPFFTVSIGSLLKTNSDDMTRVYGSEWNLKPGLDNLACFLKLQSPTPHYAYIVKYAFQLLRLGNTMNRDRKMVDNIAPTIRSIQSKTTQLETIPFALVEKLAEVYYQNFSQLSSFQRIRIMGHKEHLGDAKNVSRIRALLLAGVRAAVLWKNVGGNQLILVFRKKMLARELLEIKKTMKKL